MKLAAFFADAPPCRHAVIDATPPLFCFQRGAAFKIADTAIRRHAAELSDAVIFAAIVFLLPFSLRYFERRCR
jgi:hypothetical protein